MALNFYTLLLSFAFFSCYSQLEYWVDYRDVQLENIPRLENISSYCTKPGLQCADCKTIILCRQVGSSLVGTQYETCEGQETCDAATCVAVPNINCAGVGYTCGVVEGMFPDPLECKSFHYCIPKQGDPPPGSNNKAEPPTLEHHKSTCKGNYYYNALTTYCDKPLPANQSCPISSIPKCAKNGQTGAVRENPTIYYICTPVTTQWGRVLYPMLDACDHGRKYDPLTYSCK
ncbi:hypothetical protein FQR65_LT13259 [Abscondita terminalis]|nr:hypothetical protein FQR65_LT13259 [Abscondita terminalis]